ncbi:MAG: hypothetical protein ACX94C_12240 [Phycisphaerales bacterium]
MDDTGEQILRRARSLLRAHTKATMLCDGTPYQVAYIIDPGSGSLVLCTEREMNGADDCVLAIPEDTFSCPMRVNITIEDMAEGHESDRYMAYHMRQDRPNWSRGVISFAKIDSGGVADGEALMKPNPLLDAIPHLCKRLNADPKALRELGRLLTKVEIENPVAVGVDEEGCDIRAEFGVVRMNWPSPVTDADECELVIASLVGGAL